MVSRPAEKRDQLLVNNSNNVYRRNFLTASAGGILFALAGCAEVEGSGSREASRSSETVVNTTASDRTHDYFEAEEGQEMEITVRHIRGQRTHVAINYNIDSPFIEAVFSEGVLEGSKTWTMDVEESGRYRSILSPASRGSVKIVLHTDIEEQGDEE